MLLAQFQSFVEEPGSSCTAHFPPHSDKQAMNLLTEVLSYKRHQGTRKKQTYT